MKLFFYLVLVVIIGNPILVSADSETMPDVKEQVFTTITNPVESIQKIEIEEISVKKEKSFNEIFYKKIKPSAEDENPEAMFYYGLLLDREGEYEEAVRWIKKSADVGNKDAIKYLEPKTLGFAAGMWAKIRNLRDDAYKNFAYAANQGNAQAQFHLGVLYDEDGDNLTATQWYIKAAAAGQPAAQAIIDMTKKYE